MGKLADILAGVKLFFMCLFNKVYSALKRRAGFVDLGIDAVIEGAIVWSDGGSADGDVSMFLHVDPPYTPFLYYKGNMTKPPEGEWGDMMIEVTPCEQPALKAQIDQIHALLMVGQKPRVRVKGRWVYDGVHIPNTSMFWQVLKALWGHPPVDGAWTELHPVQKIELL